MRKMSSRLAWAALAAALAVAPMAAVAKMNAL